MMGIIEQLIQFHRSEKWHSKELSDADLTHYFESVLAKGRIILCYGDEDKVLGYVESWRITREGLAKLILNEPFLPDQEEIQNGKICYFANCSILPDYIKSEVAKNLKIKFFKQNFSCEYFVGHSLRKRHKPLTILKRSEAIKRYGEDNDRSSEEMFGLQKAI